MKNFKSYLMKDSTPRTTPIIYNDEKKSPAGKT